MFWKDDGDKLIRQQEEQILDTLYDHGLPAEMVEIFVGPTVTRFGIAPANGVKVNKIAQLADDLAVALATDSVRIQTRVPGKGYIGVEIPSETRSAVELLPIVKNGAFSKVSGALRIVLGVDTVYQPVIYDLTEMPHLLIGGATGSGKSVALNTIISCLLIDNPPKKLRLAMIDPKRVELTAYNGIPHLMRPVVTETNDAIDLLGDIVDEMESRFEKLESKRARNIVAYNRRSRKNKMPYVAVVIDELADLMLSSDRQEETEKHIVRLAQKSRATGIHLVVATQRPTVDVVTGLIKANMPTRIAFRVASSVDSRVILDQAGAETLLGKGDGLLVTPESDTLVRFQGCIISDKDIDAIVNELERRYGRRVN